MEAIPFHIAIVTDDLETSMRDVSAALGLSWTSILEADGTTMHAPDGTSHPRPRSCVSIEGPLHVDLMHGEPGTVWGTTGPRIHHAAYRTDDLAADVERLGRDGWRVELALRDDDDRPVVFAYLTDAAGRRIELVDEVGWIDYQDRLERG